MKSLEARKAAREKQRQEEQKLRDEGGLPKEQQAEDNGGSVASNESDDPTAQNRGTGEATDTDDGDAEPMDAEQADEWVADSVENIKANLGDLSDEDLTAVEEAEKRGKARVSVSEAIAKERDARKSGDWNPNKD